MADDFPVSLVLSGGSLTLSGTNAYSGGTTVSGSGMLVATNDEAFEDGSNLYVGNYSFPFGTVVTAGESASQTAVQGAAAAVPEPGTLTLCAGRCSRCSIANANEEWLLQAGRASGDIKLLCVPGAGRKLCTEYC